MRCHGRPAFLAHRGVAHQFGCLIVGSGLTDTRSTVQEAIAELKALGVSRLLPEQALCVLQRRMY